MIGEAYAKTQVKRLAGLDFFPSEGAAVKELVIALQRAKSEASAKNTIDSIMESAISCPKPAEIRAILASANKTEYEAFVPEENSNGQRCPRCRGTGWVHEVRIVKNPTCYGPEGSRNEYAGRCACGARVQ